MHSRTTQTRMQPVARRAAAAWRSSTAACQEQSSTPARLTRAIKSAKQMQFWRRAWYGCACANASACGGHRGSGQGWARHGAVACVPPSQQRGKARRSQAQQTQALQPNQAARSNKTHLLHQAVLQAVHRQAHVQHGQAGGVWLRCGAQHHGPRRRLAQHVFGDVHAAGGPKLQGCQLRARQQGKGGKTGSTAEVWSAVPAITTPQGCRGSSSL